jgi:hypothetical protein
MRLLAAALALTFALAGCTSDDAGDEHVHNHVTCHDGTEVEVPANHTGPPEAACPPMRAPTVNVTQAPASVRIFAAASFAWVVDPGDHKRDAHSMLTSLRVATASAQDAALAGPDSFGTEVAKREHQNLPTTATASHTFTVPGTYFVRAYAEVQAHGMDAKDYWSPEVTVVVEDVLPTGNNTVVTHGVGNVAGKLTPDNVTLGLGDGIVLKNDDLTDHVFTPQACAQSIAAVTVPRQSSSQPIVFKAPGTCTFKTDDVQALTLVVNVRS